MNLLVRGRHSLIAFKLIRSQLTRNDFQSISRPFDGNQMVVNKRHYSLTTTLIMMSPYAPLAGIVAGRLIQRQWPRLRYTDRKAIIDLIYENKLKFLSVVGLIGGAFITAIDRFIEETPLTKRQRFVVFNKKDYEPISYMTSKNIIKTHKNYILDVDDRIAKRVDKILRKLLECNKNFEEIAHKNWSVYVIRAPNTTKYRNAFALPTGQIFVYTGIINCCDNDDQLAVILAHELSHIFLDNAKEMVIKCYSFEL